MHILYCILWSAEDFGIMHCWKFWGMSSWMWMSFMSINKLTEKDIPICIHSEVPLEVPCLQPRNSILFLTLILHLFCNCYPFVCPFCGGVLRTPSKWVRSSFPLFSPCGSSVPSALLPLQRPCPGPQDGKKPDHPLAKEVHVGTGWEGHRKHGTQQTFSPLGSSPQPITPWK